MQLGKLLMPRSIESAHNQSLTRKPYCQGVQRRMDLVFNVFLFLKSLLLLCF